MANPRQTIVTARKILAAHSKRRNRERGFGVGHGETPGLVPGCYQRILHVGADPLDGGTRAVGRDLEDIAGRVSDTEANHLWRVVGPLVDDAET